MCYFVAYKFIYSFKTKKKNNLIFSIKPKKVKPTKGKKGKEEVVEEVIEEVPEETENEKQLKMIEDLESGGVIAEIDLTTEDWVNVDPNDMPKRYEAVRKYVMNENLFEIFMFEINFLFTN